MTCAAQDSDSTLLRDAAIFFLAVIGVIWMANRAMIYHRATLLVPDKIRTSGLEHIGSSPSPLLCALLIRCETSGAVVMRLSKRSADEIEREGLAFFDDAELARGVLESSRGRARYRRWSASPLPPMWGRTESTSGLWSGLAHAGIGPFLGPRLKSAWGKGAYYTAREVHDGQLVVIPSERLVVYSWRD